MDHLPQPLHPHEGVRCRYKPNTFGPDPSKKHNFFDFDRETGFRLIRLLKGFHENDLVPNQVEGVFQAWLYFTVLRDVLDSDIEDQEFVVVDAVSNTSYLCTSQLPHYISRWHKRFNSSSDEISLASHQETIRKRTTSTLRAATYILNRMLKAFDRRIEPVRLISHEFEIAVRVLIQTLEFHLLPNDLPRQRVFDEFGSQICPLLIEKLIAYDWCPNQVNMLASTLDVPSLYYATLLGPDSSGKDHSTCTDRVCKANQVDQSKYETAHVTSGCDCSHFGPSSHDLANIVQNGHVPIVSVIFDHEAKVHQVEVQQFSEGMNYVAISHVWADGMGNPRGNTLPACQLKRLSDSVQNVLPDNPLFWCDTLCVPTKPSELRRKAIWKMRNVYSDAHTVLVIDASLFAASVHCSAEELLMRVTCSGWMRRLWTYQENVLAPRLRILLKDGNAGMNRAVTHARNATDSDLFVAVESFKSSLGWEASAFCRSRLPFGELSFEPSALQGGVGIGVVWDSVQWRMTSWASDEPICLATALGVDLPTILNTPEDDRMKVLYSSISEWPPYLIFAEFDRMTEPGWKWAPRSLMYPRSMNTSKMPYMKETTRWDKEGLIVKFPGFIMDLESLPRKTNTSSNGPTSDKPNSRIDLNGTFYFKSREDNPKWYYFCADDQPIRYGVHRTIAGLKKPAVVLSCPVEALRETPSSVAQLWDGLLVDVSKHEDGIVFSDYVVKVLAGLAPASLIDELEQDLGVSMPSVDQQGFEVPPGLCLAWCDVLSDQQRWCVG